MHLRLAGLVLAGGQARRMGGGDKTLLPVGGRPILAAAIDAIGLPDIAISANGDPARFAAFGRPVLPDRDFAGEGPLAGLLAGLRWAATGGFDALLTVPGDMPFLPAGFVRALLPAPAAARHGAQVHHLVASWPVSAGDALQSFLERQRSRRVADFAAYIGSLHHDFSLLPAHVFSNINDRLQLERAQTPISSREDNDRFAAEK